MIHAKASGYIQVGEQQFPLDVVYVDEPVQAMTLEEYEKMKERWVQLRETGRIQIAECVFQDWHRLVALIRHLSFDIMCITPKPHAHRKPRSQRRARAFARQKARANR